MKCSKSYIQTAIILLTLLSGCSPVIYEDRDECPCTLVLNIDNKNVNNYSIWILDNYNNTVHCSSLHPGNNNQEYSISIPREKLQCYIWGNISGNTEIRNNIESKSGILLIKKEETGADSLYFWHSEIDSRNKESVNEAVSFTKEHLNVQLSLTCSSPAKDLYLLATSNTIGADISNRTLSGETKAKITCLPTEKSGDTTLDTIFSFNILRPTSLQGLYVSIVNAPNNRQLYKIDLGKLMQECSYDIYKKDLDDIKISLNLFTGSIKIQTGIWDFEPEINITI